MKHRILLSLLLAALLAPPALGQDEEKPDASARFLSARKILLRGDPATAAELFRAIVREEPKAEVADDCLYWMGRCWLRRKDREPDAVVALNRLFREYPTSPWLDDAARELRRLGDRTIVPELVARLEAGGEKAEPAARALAEFDEEAGLAWLEANRGEKRVEPERIVVRERAKDEIAEIRREVARLRAEIEEALVLLRKLIEEKKSGADGAGEDGK